MRAEDDAIELHRMNPTLRFTDRARDYVRYRPDYPARAIDAVLGGLGGPASLVAADVGAGTGISARLLADRGVRVFAVEPNAAMRDEAAPHPRVTWIDAAAEATGLGPESLDLLLCAQAFHWFRQREALVEFHRVLRPRGRLALVWNSRDRSDPLTLGYIEAIHAVNGEDPAEQRPFDPEWVSAEGLFTPPGLETFAHAQDLDLAGFIGRAASASYVPKEGRPFERLMELLAALFERHRDPRGRITLRYVTKVYLAERT